MRLYRRFLFLRRWIEAHSLIGLGAGLAIFLAAFLARIALDNQLPPGFPYLTFFPAIVVATFLFGTRAGVLCAALSFCAAWYFFLPPLHSFSITAPSAVALGFFVLIVAVNVAIIDRLLAALSKLEAARRQAVQFARQRDALFKELQHRVGNNLNMIASMLAIQSRGLQDEAARHQLGEASRRIQLVADINRMFHDPAHADGRFDEGFVRELAEKCLDAAGMRDKVAFSANIDALAFRQDDFLPLALVLAESINNALEHGVAGHEAAFLRVSLKADGDQALLLIENSGTPLAEGFDAARSGSIGLMLVHAFARQLGGSYTLSGGAETRSLLRFPLTRALSAETALEPPTR